MSTNLLVPDAQTILKLQAILPETVVLAAFDIVDRGNVIKYTTSWGHTHYEVLGSLAAYPVFIDLQAGTATTMYCSCPAFTYAVLTSGTHLMCKHILATRIAKQLQLYVQRGVEEDFLTNNIVQHYTNH
ncbi:hypothetical protein D9758_001867 [Tetrapyrgos nigripes]|uniref:SWIM-type domain-containing protein n=1 Tax=Tetrapyrgos nigripes TaxID=182062 RepID=A0A8H5GTJ3_9AGAR|nr:hypothetical protein D9758_001867 [Tetrapyrgos nigripes]